MSPTFSLPSESSKHHLLDSYHNSTQKGIHVLIDFDYSSESIDRSNQNPKWYSISPKV